MRKLGTWKRWSSLDSTQTVRRSTMRSTRTETPPRGSPTRAIWCVPSPDTSLLAKLQLQNRWLVALRQLCCHPQVGQANKKGLGKVLKTVEDVLATMMEAAISSWMSDFRSLWATRVRRAQFLMFDLESCERFEEALEVFQEAVEELGPIIEEVAGNIREVWQDRRAERCLIFPIETRVR